MTDGQALLAAIFVINDAITEFKESEWYDKDDPWLKNIKEAQDTLKKMFERM